MTSGPTDMTFPLFLYRHRLLNPLLDIVRLTRVFMDATL